MEFVISYSERRLQLVHHVLRKNAVVVAANKQPDRLVIFRRVERMLDHHFVAKELPEVCRFEFAGLDLDDQIPMKRHDIEQQIDQLLLSAQLDGIFRTHERHAQMQGSSSQWMPRGLS